MVLMLEPIRQTILITRYPTFNDAQTFQRGRRCGSGWVMQFILDHCQWIPSAVPRKKDMTTNNTYDMQVCVDPGEYEWS